MYYIVTGAAGFIGSNLVKALNARGETNIIAVDNLSHADKFRNLADCEIADYFDKQDFLRMLHDGAFGGELGALFHQGACSDTLQTDGRYMMENNYRYSVALFEFCQLQGAPLIYASSAAIYGAGGVFKEAPGFEAPLNIYAYSKFLFDRYVRREAAHSRSQVAGLRYFNVYGPRETHKSHMASVAYHFFNQYTSGGRIRLFAGSGGYADGMQQRDFVTVEDVVAVNLYFLDHPQCSGIFNVGTGTSRSFNDVAQAAINTCRTAAGQPPLGIDEMRRQGLIEYTEIPAALRGKYQSYTEADISALRHAGFDTGFTDVETGVPRYLDYLLKTRPL
ncbi:MAG: ADP-glyceromanno-heptose 6-epimerase [Burkholderiales bacterium]